ncbi:hypothetical protein EVAR_76513_1 [Eumeta japonica]|uniref:Uncharacterized protein n=1 Tax=Eumeta variegata TaxID=151549 RepID=A0A4C1T4Z4_EUMVA|nr:hypothetical protein EVAR_76513_1 [Eumeta japonica]
MVYLSSTGGQVHAKRFLVRDLRIAAHDSNRDNYCSFVSTANRFAAAAQRARAVMYCFGEISRLDKVRNEFVRGSFKVAPIAEKLEESRYGHILKRKDSHRFKKALDICGRPRRKGRYQPTLMDKYAKRDLEREPEYADKPEQSFFLVRMHKKTRP